MLKSGGNKRNTQNVPGWEQKSPAPGGKLLRWEVFVPPFSKGSEGVLAAAFSQRFEGFAGKAQPAASEALGGLGERSNPSLGRFRGPELW